MTTATEFMNDSAKQVSDVFARTMQSGARLHEEAAKFWAETSRKQLDDQRAQFEKMVDEAAPFSRKNAERFQKFFDEQADRSLDMLRKSFDSARATNPTQACESLMNLWRSSFETMRESADAMAKFNSDIFASWNDMLRKNGCMNTPAPEAAMKRPAGK